MKEWKETVTEFISSSGMTMTEMSRKLDIPYRTLQDWKSGKRVPDKFTQYAFCDRVADMIHNQDIWFCSDKLGCSILCKNAETVEDALKTISQSFNVTEVLRIGETAKTTINPNDIYIIKQGGVETGDAVVIKR